MEEVEIVSNSFKKFGSRGGGKKGRGLGSVELSFSVLLVFRRGETWRLQLNVDGKDSLEDRGESDHQKAQDL